MLLILAHVARADDALEVRTRHVAEVLGKNVLDMANKGDIPAIEKIIQSEDDGWKGAPSVSHFENMEAIASQLRCPVSASKRFWLFRRAFVAHVV